MVELILNGGLGNQMFQFAAAKALSLRLGTNLKLDLYALNKHTTGTKREYELDIFDVNTQFTSRCKNKLLIKGHPIVKKNKKFVLKYFGCFLDGSAIVYVPEFEQLGGNITLHGYFQNPKYFGGYEEVIKTDFTFRYPLDTRNKELSKKIRESNSVSIHIRRGDYLTNEQARNNFATCSLEYYQIAIEYILQRVDNAQFYIFSDDIDWAKNNLSFANNLVEYVDWNNNKESYKDMQLMSICKHNIIANSSFSWWGAWLNNYKSKIVIAPNQWFNKEERNKDLLHFYPSDWIKI